MSRAKIMVMEEEGTISRDLPKMLTNLGYDVAPVMVNLEDASRRVEEICPDLILLDLKLMVDKGEEVRGYPRGIPIVCMTTGAGDIIIKGANIREPIGYVSRPFQERELDAVIEKAIHRGKEEETLIYRKEAMEAIYRMATTPNSSFEKVCDDVVRYLRDILRVECVVVCHRSGKDILIISASYNGNFSRDLLLLFKDCPSSIIYEKKKAHQFTGLLGKLFPDNGLFTRCELNSYLGVPIKRDGENVLGVISVMDGRERVFNEEEIHLMEAFSRYLAHEVERYELQKQLRTSQEKELIFQVAAGVAHEVRNPLNAILAISEALNQDLKEDGEHQPLLSYISRQVDRLSSLMKDLLELGKPIQAGNLVRVSVQTVCDSAVELWEKTNPGKRVRINRIYPLSSCKPWVMADTLKLQQVIFNLIDNAACHNPKRGEILVEVLKIKSNKVYIRVVDQGSGIKPEYLPRVFEPFFTLRKGGTGLGLSIVKHIVEAFSGEISIANNTPFPGVTVEITLPLAVDPK